MAKVTSLTGVYPMDSMVTAGDDGLPVYDRPYHATDLRRVMASYLTDGVFADSGDVLSVTREGDTWRVGSGTAMADGLRIPVPKPCEVIDQAEISIGRYAYIVVAGRFDTPYRDGAIYAVVTESPSYSPVRDASTWELVLARIDWRGGLTDTRMDNSLCGIVQPFAELDTEKLMLELRTAVDQFNLNVGEVSTGEPGSTPVVTVRKPEVAGGDVFIDFKIPRGPEGEPGRDGESAPTLYISPESEEPPRAYGNVWMVDDKATHTVTALKSYETDRVYPGAETFPGAGTYPGGMGQWVPHTISQSLIAAQ